MKVKYMIDCVVCLSDPPVCLSDAGLWEGETGSADGRLKVETVSKPVDKAEAHGTENLLLLPNNPNTQTYRGLNKYD